MLQLASWMKSKGSCEFIHFHHTNGSKRQRFSTGFNDEDEWTVTRHRKNDRQTIPPPPMSPAPTMVPDQHEMRMIWVTQCRHYPDTVTVLVCFSIAPNFRLSSLSIMGKLHLINLVHWQCFLPAACILMCAQREVLTLNTSKKSN